MGNLSEEVIWKSLSDLEDDAFLETINDALKCKPSTKETNDAIVWDENERNKLAEMLCEMLLCLAASSRDQKQFESKITQSGIQAERASILSSQFSKLKNCQSSEVSSIKNREQLCDLEWKFGVTAVASAEGQQGATFVEVRLVTTSPHDNSQRTHYFHMLLQQFYEFLHQLEKAKTSLEYMK